MIDDIRMHDVICGDVRWHPLAQTTRYIWNFIIVKVESQKTPSGDREVQSKILSLPDIQESWQPWV